MMPGPHNPPAVPMHQGRRQDNAYHYQLPPQTHSPVHNPYAQYAHPQHYGAPLHQPYPPPMQQWQYQYQPQYAPQHAPQPQYVMPPRAFQPHGSPVVVSSHPHMAPSMTPVNRQIGQTPPVVHSRSPPVPRHLTPQPAPSTPSVASVAAAQGTCPTPPTALMTPTPPPMTPATPASMSPSVPPKSTFMPPTPWLSNPGEPFPPRASRKKKRRRALVPSTDQGLALPAREQTAVEETTVKDARAAEAEEPSLAAEEPDESQSSTLAAESIIETPSTSPPRSEVADSASLTTPSTTAPPPARPAPASHTRTVTIPAVPDISIPIKSAKPNSVASIAQKSAKSHKAPVAKEEPQKTENAPPPTVTSVTAEAKVEANVGEALKTSPASAKPAAPMSWAGLLRSKQSAATPAQAPVASNSPVATNGSTAPKSNSLADVLASFSVHSDKKVSFLEPRGLVNSGNLCYMNSILQVLVFCVPFYDFLDQVAKRTAHSIKSETPLIDAMIEFMHDFKVIDSATTPEKLRLRLKDAELEQYGAPLAPEQLYAVIRKLPRFNNMKHGQQEDAEEFLGFMLSGMHEECEHVIKTGRRPSVSHEAPTSPTGARSGSVDSGWLEVGAKQKSSVTQSSGTIEIESPVTKTFGGKLRSEYRKPGEKPSVTLQPYQELQLDIGSPNIHNISDALRGITHLETLDGALHGARASTKQVFIDTLPPVLILHLKRFHYDANGPHKIWKKIGYPLELEIPKEVFPPHVRGSFAARGGLPHYKLTAVVYHHGKNASGGHYTVDLRRQEGQEWIRLDDTIIRRIRKEDVAEGGAEEDPKVLAAALEQHNKDAGAGKSNNFYELGMDEEKKDEGGWSKVIGADKPKDATKKWSGVVNGTASPTSAGKSTPVRESVRDNKVAYILFYQRIEV